MSSNIDLNEFPERKGRGPGFDKRLIMEIVLAIENGLRRGDAVKPYGTLRSSVSEWMREYGSQSYHGSKQGHLNLHQRRSIVRAIEDFTYRITISWWIFAATALAALVIAILTIGFQIFKVAIDNPVRSL